MKKNNRGISTVATIITVAVITLAVIGAVLWITFGGKEFSEGYDTGNGYENEWAGLRFEVPQNYKFQGKNRQPNGSVQFLYADPMGNVIGISVSEQRVKDFDKESEKEVKALENLFKAAGLKLTSKIGQERLLGKKYNCCYTTGEGIRQDLLIRNVGRKGSIMLLFQTVNGTSADMEKLKSLVKKY